MEEVEKVFLSYLDENDVRIDGYVELIHLDSSLIKFKTKGNLISLPTTRILKLKQKLNEVGEYENN